MELKQNIEKLFNIEDITKKTSTRNYVTARMLYSYYRSQIMQAGLQAITDELGYATHSTVSHLIKQAKALLEYDKEFQRQYYIILNNINPEEYLLEEYRREISRLQVELREIDKILPMLKELPKDKVQEVISKLSIIIQATKRNL